MSTDKTSGSDHRPDQAPGPERKPFPGQPDTRPPVPPPAGTKTADELRADRTKYKTTSEYTAAAETARKTAGLKPGTSDAVPAGGSAAARPADTQSVVVPGVRGRNGSMPDSAPARDSTGGQRPAETRDRDPAPRPDAPGIRKPEELAHPDRTLMRPFPSQPDNRPSVPPPTGTKTADELRADRAKYKTTSEYTAAKAAEKTAPRQSTADDATAAKRAAGTTAERATAKPREDTAGTQPGSGKHPENGATGDKTGPPHDRGHPHGTPDDEGRRQPGDHGVLTHAHSEFKGEKLDLYTDGTRWASADATRNEHQRGKQETHPERPEDLHHGWDQGRNIVGEKPGRSPGDASDLPPAGQELLDTHGDKPRKSEARRQLWDDGDDMVDVVQNNVDDVHDIFTPPPTGSYTQNPMPAPGPHFSGQPQTGADIGTAAATLLVLGLAAERGSDLLRKHWRTHSKGGT